MFWSRFAIAFLVLSLGSCRIVRGLKAGCTIGAGGRECFVGVEFRDAQKEDSQATSPAGEAPGRTLPGSQ